MNVHRLKMKGHRPEWRQECSRRSDEQDHNQHTTSPRLRKINVAVRKIAAAVQTNMSTVHRNPNKKLEVKPNPSIDDITAVEKQVVRFAERLIKGKDILNNFGGNIGRDI